MTDNRETSERFWYETRHDDQHASHTLSRFPLLHTCRKPSLFCHPLPRFHSPQLGSMVDGGIAISTVVGLGSKVVERCSQRVMTPFTTRKLIKG